MKFEAPNITIFFFGKEDILTASVEITTSDYWNQTAYPCPECPAELPMD